jgi:hypothetical protein
MMSISEDYWWKEVCIKKAEWILTLPFVLISLFNLFFNFSCIAALTGTMIFHAFNSEAQKETAPSKEGHSSEYHLSGASASSI